MYLLLAFVSLAVAHFVLEIPTSVGYEDIKEATPPCGGFDITSRTAITEWPLVGAPLKIISTHPRSQYTIQATLLSDAAAASGGNFNFTKIAPLVTQSGRGGLCLPAVSGIAAWEGKDAVVQVIQMATDGKLYQCVAVKFVAGPAAAVPSLCKNSTGVTATFQTEAETGTCSNLTTTTGLNSTACSSPGLSTTSPAPTPKGGAGRLHPGMITIMFLVFVSLLVL